MCVCFSAMTHFTKREKQHEGDNKSYKSTVKVTGVENDNLSPNKNKHCLKSVRSLSWSDHLRTGMSSWKLQCSEVCLHSSSSPRKPCTSWDLVEVHKSNNDNGKSIYFPLPGMIQHDRALQ